MNNWEQDWCDNAVEIIQTLVGHFQLCGLCLPLICIFQMEEYRGRDTPTTVSITQHSNVALDSWQEFVVEYEAELADGRATFNHNPPRQTVQEEYSTYVMGALAAGSTSNTLEFWRVSFFPGNPHALLYSIATGA